MMIKTSVKAPNKSLYKRRTPAEILRDQKAARLLQLQKELAEIRKDDFPGRIKSNGTLRKELELLRLQEEQNR